MSSNDVSSLLADAEFRNDILALKQMPDSIRFCCDVIKEDLDQASQPSNVEFVGPLVEATDDRLLT